MRLDEIRDLFSGDGVEPSAAISRWARDNMAVK